uniref:Ribosome-recycling factor, chloroplastic n=1 Tax=Physcomitrium patens TaxID=3218 RepID=A0A7I4CJU2_PHYPA
MAAAASTRRLRSLRHSLLGFAARTLPPLTSRFPSSGPAFCAEVAHIDQLGSAQEELCSKDFEVVGSVSLALLGRSGFSLPRGADWPWGWRRDTSVAENGVFSHVLGVGVRGLAAKAKKSGGKSRGDDGGGQVVATPGPSAKETASRLMEAALNALSVELSKLRTGRATPGMLDHVNVMSHGVQTPLSHVAAVSVSNLETLTVMPYDTSMVKEVEKAIRNSPLKLNPMAEGEVLRVPIPKLTKEHIQVGFSAP